MADRIDIGIDGGGTGCRVALSVAGGPIVETRGGPANIVTDPAAAEAAIRLALTEALAARDLGFEALPQARICAGLAGGRLPGAADAFATRLPYLAYVVDDSVTALEGALEGADGTLASLGTGSFFIRKAGGVTRHIGGWGFRLGDEGSAAWAGRKALSLALRVADGRLPPDPLAEALIDACPPHPVLWAATASPGDFAQLVRIVMAHPESAMAARIHAAILKELTEGLTDLGHQPNAPLVLTGGLGEMLAPHLPEALTSGLRPALGRPLDGALRLARGLP
ncbi:BadF/BadG/BcrA/BcrD ATPase family protein [Roseicyclus marinus]|uniref:BadF/BadG/BcrA/BcrD ATPase family protein n=1 Tax=Roseicyclus marinus TaxID=2161673 RepID=UPI002410AEB2|nr:BadF/BadG/BcrA/BcrD ATPase family protein [Roseicyclus marinus]MDG3040224.1 BadF/BadG/BcrA/BcrD ATPase family protein [Roseicyclus marinus]